MTRRIFSCPVLIFLIWSLAQSALADQNTNLIVIDSVEVNGSTVSPSRDGKVHLGSRPQNIIFHFGPNTNGHTIRLRDRLEGYENEWHAGPSEMALNVRFFTPEPQASQISFKVHGESAGWTGSLKTSKLTHRQETITVPQGIDTMIISVSSAGPPEAQGVYAVADLTVSEFSSNHPPKLLVRSPLGDEPFNDFFNIDPPDWMRDGMKTKMATVVGLGPNSITRAFMVTDNDPAGHAEWHTKYPVKVVPGDKLLLEWNEVYSIGDGSARWNRYDTLAPGEYLFRVAEVDIFGVPTGVETILPVVVTLPFWERPWFWGLVLMGIVSGTFGTARYITWHRMQRQIVALQTQQALERERLRIARDIHDDLGARVTEISWICGMSQDESRFPEAARANFTQISQISRDMVSALYQTVWAVNPENDNLNAVGDHFCQIVNQLCKNAPFPCYIHMQDLPREVQISSQTRHNISMVLKEAVHNAVKHSKAANLNIHITFAGNLLKLIVQDDGCGFQPGNSTGNGLGNMQQRMADIGGQCKIESQPGQGTTVHITLPLLPPNPS